MILNTLLLTIFYVSLGIIIYTYILFPAMTVIRGNLFKKTTQFGDEKLSVSIIIAAHNEEDVIADKLTNTLALTYPADKMEVIVASNGSTDRTADIVKSFEAQDSRFRLLDIPQKGKNPALNIALKEAKGEIFVFTDADSLLDPDSLNYLIAPLSDPSVGGVGGDYRYVNKSGSKEGTGEKTYWSFDRYMKEMQSRAGSMTSATGQLYAIRREYTQTVPSGVTDDFFTSTQAIANHKRLVFEPRAFSVGPVADDKGEYRRKLRVTTRGLNSVKAQSKLLNPFKYGYYAVQLFSHKVLRRLVVFPIILVMLTAPLLWGQGLFYQLVTAGSVALVLAIIVSSGMHSFGVGKNKLSSLIMFFYTVNRAAFMATFKVLNGERIDVWATERAG